jgi:hypothetical protein
VKNLMLFLLALSATSFAAADDREAFDRLEMDIHQQVICLDLVEGNFAGKQQKDATRKFFAAIVSNIRTYIELGTKIGIQDLVVIREYVGSDDVLVGVFLGAMLSDDAELLQEKERLQEGRRPEAVHQLLWQSHGCDAVFAALPAER